MLEERNLNCVLLQECFPLGTTSTTINIKNELKLCNLTPLLLSNLWKTTTQKRIKLKHQVSTSATDMLHLTGNNHWVYIDILGKPTLIKQLQ
jgi:hypothetical protein